MVIRYRIVYPDELNHHGVKGMKWGVRRDRQRAGIMPSRREQNEQRKRLDKYTDPNRSLINKIRNRKEQKKLVRDRRNKLHNEARKYENDFDKSKEGSKLLKQYQKEIDIMMNTENWGTSKQEAKFAKAEESYLRGSSRAAAKGLLKEFGAKEFKSMLEADARRSIKQGEDLVKYYEDTMWWRHAM